MRYQREDLSTALIEELNPLLYTHWVEIAHYLDIPLHVDWQRYAEIDTAGKLRLYTVRTNERELAGYAAFIVSRNLHYLDSLQAIQDVLFLHPAVRGRMIGARLIRFSDKCLQLEGVQVVYQHVKDAHNFGPLLERLGYERVESIWARRLDHGHHRSNHGINSQHDGNTDGTKSGSTGRQGISGAAETGVQYADGGETHPGTSLGKEEDSYRGVDLGEGVHAPDGATWFSAHVARTVT